MVTSGEVRQLQKLGKESLTYIRDCKALQKYIQRKELRSHSSAITYKTRLTPLGYFIWKRVGKTHSMDEWLEELKSGKAEPLEFVSDYAIFLKNEMKVSDDDLRQKGKIARLFLRAAGVKIDAEEFKEYVPLPRKVQPELEPAERSDIIELLKYCKNQRLKAAILMTTSLGCRIGEACGVRNNDVDLQKGTIAFRGEITKTKVTRTRPMTAELIKQIKHWQAEKYRPHRTTVFGKKSMLVRPVKEDDDVLLAFWTQKEQPKPAFLADTLGNEFRELASTMNIPKKNGKYVITFHRLRAYVFSTLSSLGDTEFANWYIGHANSTYYRRSEKDKRDAFNRVQQYLQFLEVEAMEATTQEMQTRIDDLQRQLIEKDASIDKLIEEKLARYGIKKMQELPGKFAEYKKTNDGDKDYEES